MKAIQIFPGAEPQVVEIDGSLEGMQAVVGGFVEHLSLTPTIDVWVNEEGLLLALPYNRTLGGAPLYGPILVTAHDPQGEIVGLTEEQVTFALPLFRRAPEINVSERGVA